MTQQEYEQKKQECWNRCVEDVGIIGYTQKLAHDYAFDRAYALGKQTEAITQEDVENAAKKYAAEVDKNVRDLYGIENPPASLTFGECAAESFREGANFALGKQGASIGTINGDVVINL